MCSVIYKREREIYIYIRTYTPLGMLPQESIANRMETKRVMEMETELLGFHSDSYHHSIKYFQGA